MYRYITYLYTRIYQYTIVSHSTPSSQLIVGLPHVLDLAVHLVSLNGWLVGIILRRSYFLLLVLFYKKS